MSTLETYEEDDADLTVKTHLNGEDLARRMRMVDEWYDHEDPLTLILIHGFRTDEAQAARNYGHFKRQLAQIDPHLSACTFTFSWPSTSRVLDGLAFFSAKDQVARDAGRLLGDGLLRDLKRNRRAPRDYVLVAHSLGSRVVMEALSHVLTEQPEASDRFRIVLMAAALPIEDYGTRDTLTDYARIASQVRSADVLHSDNDFILKKVFPAGYLWQTKQAVGLKGQPAHPWDAREAFEPYEHDHYWKDVDGRVTQHIAERLDFAVARSLPQSVSSSGDVLPSGLD